MHVKIHLAWMAGIVALLILLGKWICRPRDRATPDDPLYAQHRGHAGRVVPVGARRTARKVCKVGNQWTCEINGQPMVYNEAASRWEPKQK